MKAIVTGGAGFIGSNLVDALIKDKIKVSVIDNLSSGDKRNINPKAKFIKADVCSKKIEEIVAAEKPDFIFHLAAQINVRKSVDDPAGDADINILGSLRLLEAARKAKVKKFIFSSSGGAIYGDAKIIPTPEDYQTEPVSPYGVAKLSFEHYLKCFNYLYKIPFVVLRYSNVYGPRQSTRGEAGVVAIFIDKILNNEVPVINGDGKQTRDFVFVGDVVRANILAMNPRISGTYNIGTGFEASINEVHKTLNKIIGKNNKPIYGKAKLGDGPRSAINPSLANKKMGWTPEVDLYEGLEKTVLWFRNGK